MWLLVLLVSYLSSKFPNQYQNQELNLMNPKKVFPNKRKQTGEKKIRHFTNLVIGRWTGIGGILLEMGSFLNKNDDKNKKKKKNEQIGKWKKERKKERTRKNLKDKGFWEDFTVSRLLFCGQQDRDKVQVLPLYSCWCYSKPFSVDHRHRRPFLRH